MKPMTMPTNDVMADDAMTEETKQGNSNKKVSSADTVWPPPPVNQKETAFSEGNSSVARKPYYFLAVLQGMGLNLVAYWLLLIVGNVVFPRKIGTVSPGDYTFFWICWGLALAINAVAFAVVPKNKRYSAFLILGAALMSGISWLLESFLTGISI